MRPLTPEIAALRVGYDPSLPAAERQHCLRRAVAEAKARLARRVAERLAAIKGDGSNALATRDDALRDHLIAYLTGDAPVSGEAVRVQGDLFQVLTSCTELMHEVAHDLKDGRIDKREAKRLLKMLRKIVQLIEARVIPDLEALHG